MRVYEVARELGIDNKELMRRIATLGIPVSNHMSVLEQFQVEQIKRAVEKENAGNVVEERIRPTVVRRKRKKDDDDAPAPVAAAPPPPACAARMPEDCQSEAMQCLANHAIGDSFAVDWNGGSPSIVRTYAYTSDDEDAAASDCSADLYRCLSGSC